MGTRYSSIRKLQKLAQEADVILKQELSREKIDYTLAEARIINVKSVGVQGDERTYYYPVEITLYHGSHFIWGNRGEFLERLSNRVTNEVKGINRVIYTVGRR
ncbi:MAG: hypothetical protein Q8Q31_02875 [Nanoarchaeota archaeon]|nr:hypothetical protein [Nanoarchaeota archaeon]